MTLRVYDDEGTPYEQTIDIRETVHRTEIPYNNTRRAKRKRKDTNALTNGDLPAAADLVLSLGDVLSEERDMREWNLTEWSDADDDRTFVEPFEWIKIDADLEWICEVSLTMPEWMYVTQLQQDRDVVAQYEVLPRLVEMLISVHQVFRRLEAHGDDCNGHDAHSHG
jgi:transcription initiation factor TFIID subunit 2